MVLVFGTGSGRVWSDRVGQVLWVFQPKQKADGVTSTFAYTEVASVVRSVRHAGVRAEPFPKTFALALCMDPVGGDRQVPTAGRRG
jgi:hypothetical protein